jgi:hypothetical protein
MLAYIFNAIYHTFFSPVNEIIPGIWLGNSDAAVDHNFITDNKIDIVVNCTPNIPFIIDTLDQPALMTLHTITPIRIPVYDSLLEKDIILMEQYLKIIIPYLYKQYTTEHKRILIHCYAGKQRSGIVVAALLYMLHRHQQIDCLKVDGRTDIESALFNYILSKRPQAFTYGFRINFLKSFQRFYGIRIT